jgi:hypothetical protein
MVDYRETQSALWWVLLALIIGAVGMSAAAVWLWLDPTTPVWMRILFTVLAPGMIWALLVFRRLDILVADGQLTFGFGPFRPSVAVDEIEGVSREPITLTRYGGVGIRFGQGAVCYNTRFGEGLRIRVRGRSRDYVLTTDYPEELARALGQPLKDDV